MRLDKFLCKSTELNRAQAQAVIEQGEVSVNQQIETRCEMQVHENNRIEWQDKILVARPSRYIMLHKPAGFQCSNSDGHYPSAMNLLDLPKVDDLHIAGRLDADTTGLVLISDDGRWTFNITQPQKQCFKTYHVELRDKVTNKFSEEELIEHFSRGIQLQGEQQLTLPAKLSIINQYQVSLIISEGKYHQVKRMFAAVGNKVVKLHRHAIAEITLDLEAGQWRHLSEQEILSIDMSDHKS